MKQHYHPHPLTLETLKTLDFLKKGSNSIFGHGVRLRKFISPFHTLSACVYCGTSSDVTYSLWYIRIIPNTG